MKTREERENEVRRISVKAVAYVLAIGVAAVWGVNKLIYRMRSWSPKDR